MRAGSGTDRAPRRLYLARHRCATLAICALPPRPRRCARRCESCHRRASRVRCRCRGGTAAVDGCRSRSGEARAPTAKPAATAAEAMVAVPVPSATANATASARAATAVASANGSLAPSPGRARTAKTASPHLDGCAHLARAPPRPGFQARQWQPALEKVAWASATATPNAPASMPMTRPAIGSLGWGWKQRATAAGCELMDLHRQYQNVRGARAACGGPP